MCLKLRFNVSLVAALLCASTPAQFFPGLKKWYEDQIGSRVSISGYRRLGYHSRTIDGDKEAYGVTEYSGQGLDQFTDFGQVHINGSNVLGVLNFDLNIQDSRFQDPQANRVSVDVNRGPWSANLGDIRGSLATGNRFARFEKSLTGGQFGYKTKRLEARVIYSEVRGEPRTVSVQGNNTAGPYYLQSSQIVRGSEQIVLDGVVLKFGEDYTMDYDLGSVSFVAANGIDGRIISPTSTIVATYEVFGFNGAKGTVRGSAFSYDFGKIGKVGLTAMSQKQGGSARNSTFQQQFLGPIAAGTSLILSYEPLDILTVKVYIGSTLQVLGQGYRFSTNNKSLLILLRDVPPDSILSVVYNPKPVNTVAGDREVLGLDYRLPLGKGGSVTYSRATGRLTNSTTPKSGVAQGVDLFYTFGKAELSGSILNVPSDYVSIETVGLQRNERAGRVNLDVRPSPSFSYGFNHDNRSIQTISSSGKSIASRFTQLGVKTEFRPKTKGLPYRISQTRMTSRGPESDSIIDATTFGTSGKSGRLDWRADLANQFASGLSTIDTKREKRKFNIQSIDSRLNYRSGANLTFDLSSSLSRIATGKESSIGRDIILGASYRPSDKFTWRTQLADSDAGQLSTLGFINGTGFGYDGNGFSGGTDQGTFNGANNARAARTDVSWSLNDKLSLNSNLNYYRTSGGVSTNSESIGFGIGANWNLNDGLSFDAIFDSSTTNFLDSNLRSTASTFSLFATGNPKGNLSFRGGINLLLTSGNSQFNQDSFGYEAMVAYRLSRRHSLSLSTDNGRLSGYLPQTTQNVSLTYQYQIWRSLALNVGYRMIDVMNRDPNLTSGAYRSRGFDIELEFNFGR